MFHCWYVELAKIKGFEIILVYNHQLFFKKVNSMVDLVVRFDNNLTFGNTCLKKLSRLTAYSVIHSNTVNTFKAKIYCLFRNRGYVLIVLRILTINLIVN